jgi:outer membrane lipoprotein-sorting protein
MAIKHVKFVILVAVFFHPVVRAAEPLISTATIEFRRECVQKNDSEIVEGTIFFRSKGPILLKIKKPLQQWMQLEGSVMTLYYPDSKKAFIIKQSNPFTLPFVQAFVGSAESDFGLEKLNFTLTKSETRNDSVHFFWAAPKSLKKKISGVHIVYSRGKLLFAEIADNHGNPQVMIACGNFYAYKGVFLPLSLAIENHEKNSPSSERVYFAVPAINTVLPPEADGFKIPPGIDIKEINL